MDGLIRLALTGLGEELEEHGRLISFTRLDRYGRPIADVFLSDGTNVNHELDKGGGYRWYRRYAPGNSALEKLKKDTREGKKRYKVDPASIPRWIYPKARCGQ